MRHHVGWGDDGGDHERDDDEVTTEVLQLLNAHHPHAGQHHHGNRHFKGQAEGEEHGQHKAQISLNVRRSRDALGRKALDEREHLPEHEVIAKGHADEKQHSAGDHQRQDQLLLMRIQARRHKRPHLPEHEWQSQQKGRHQQDLERHHEGRDHRSGNQRSALGQMRYEWRCQKVVQRPGAGKEKQEGSSHGNGNDGLDQAVTQLHQMLDKRLLRSSKLVFLGGGVCHVGSSRASGPPMQRARAQHQWNFLGR